ncbi:bromodomain-containing protein 4 [Perca flavescens]|uniref:bromodomain-containing protein 4 n=1 Tax=Perca flavescens TaxID=8167 RepID=UPI00106E6E52|nr:bromodomain-containing protein 4-like [Perca flavescens]
MSSGLDGGGGEGRGGRGGMLFLSSHRCPEVDLLPHPDSKTQIPPPRSLVPAERSHAGWSEQAYLSTCRSAGEDGEGEGSVSEWSEEDLSLHFSPSIILQSDDESDPESGFECVDVTVETQVNGPEGVGLKMVPKRLIQLKKKDVVNAAEGGGADEELSANELLRPRPDLFLRQHSMPAALPPSSSDVDGCSVYRSLVAVAPQGCNGGDSAPRQRLQKSFSLDETKTKMASCIIKSILSKKMQVEQNNSTSCLPPQTVREGGGGRDVRSLVKNTHSPPPSYHQAVGVKGHSDPALVTASRGHVAKVAASLSQSQDRKQSGKFSRPITQQRRGSELKISGGKVDDVSQSEAPRYSYVHTPRATCSPPYLFPPPELPAAPHLATCSPPPPVPTPQRYLQPPPPVPAPQRLKTSEENRSARPGPFIRTAGDWDRHGNTPTPATHGHHGNTPTAATHDHHGNTPKPAIHEQIRQLQQQAFLCFLPAQGGSDVTSSGALLRGPAPCGPAPCHMMLDPQSGRCFYVDSAPPPQRKVLLDPETGQFFQVFLPADTKPGVFAVRCANSAPTMIGPAPNVISPAPAVLSVVQFQPMVAVSSLYAPPCLAFTLHTPSAP